MALKVGKADEYVGVHNGAANFCFLYKGSAIYGNQGLVGTF